MRVRAPANIINRCNSAGGKTRHSARRPHGVQGGEVRDARSVVGMDDDLEGLEREGLINEVNSFR